jgi:hypothetical protein
MDFPASAQGHIQKGEQPSLNCPPHALGIIAAHGCFPAEPLPAITIFKRTIEIRFCKAFLQNKGIP